MAAVDVDDDGDDDEHESHLSSLTSEEKNCVNRSPTDRHAGGDAAAVTAVALDA